jgi:hypothetical protein
LCGDRWRGEKGNCGASFSCLTFSENKMRDSITDGEQEKLMDSQIFGSLFRVGEQLNSGGPAERLNAARLEILAIDERGVRYRSIRSKSAKVMHYSTLAIILRSFDRIDPRAIQRTIQPVYLGAGLKENLFTENYEYGFAREFRERQKRAASIAADPSVR